MALRANLWWQMMSAAGLILAAVALGDRAFLLQMAFVGCMIQVNSHLTIFVNSPDKNCREFLASSDGSQCAIVGPGRHCHPFEAAPNYPIVAMTVTVQALGLTRVWRHFQRSRQRGCACIIRLVA